MVTEPMTLITDYLISVVTIWFGVLILLDSKAPAAELLAASLFVTGVGAFLGGTSHGFKVSLGEELDARIWKATTYTIGLAASLLAFGVVLQFSGEVVQNLLVTLIIVAGAGYAWWMWSHSEFKYVIINYLSLMGLVIIICLVSYLSQQDAAALWIIGSIVVTIIASAIQASGFTIHPDWFNHNDLFHVVQLPAFWLLYRGVLLF